LRARRRRGFPSLQDGRAPRIRPPAAERRAEGSPSPRPSTTGGAGRGEPPQPHTRAHRRPSTAPAGARRLWTTGFSAAPSSRCPAPSRVNPPPTPPERPEALWGQRPSTPTVHLALPRAPAVGGDAPLLPHDPGRPSAKAPLPSPGAHYPHLRQHGGPAPAPLPGATSAQQPPSPVCN
jgi:hypothetical protein